jgi:CheY-like chemotaxis protein
MRANSLILIVDDYPLNRKILRKVLDKKGYQVLEAARKRFKSPGRRSRILYFWT